MKETKIKIILFNFKALLSKVYFQYEYNWYPSLSLQ